MAAHELFESRTYHAGYGRREASRFYRVDSSGDPVQAATDAGLPVLGEAYPTDPELIVVDYRGRRLNVGECSVEVVYSSMGFHAPTPRTIDDPNSVEEGLDIGTVGVLTTNDILGEPIGPFEMENRQGITVERPYGRLTLTRWESNPNEGKVYSLTGTTNSSDWKGLEAGCWLFKGAQMHYVQPGKVEVTYVCDFRPKPYRIEEATGEREPDYPNTDGWWGWEWCWYDRDNMDMKVDTAVPPYRSSVYPASDFPTALNLPDRRSGGPPRPPGLEGE